jgi:hypothetical protein
MAKQLKLYSRALCRIRELVIFALIFQFLSFAGCTKSTPGITAEQRSAFDSAPAEIKKMWQDALAADKANDYARVQTLLLDLQTKEMTKEQQQALVDEFDAYGQRLLAAAEKGNADAKNALDNWRTARSKTGIRR